MEGGLVEVIHFRGYHALQIQCRLIFFSMEIHQNTMINDTADLKERIEQEIKTRHWKMFLMVIL